VVFALVFAVVFADVEDNLFVKVKSKRKGNKADDFDKRNSYKFGYLSKLKWGECRKCRQEIALV
jgi:hypothetical protein